MSVTRSEAERARAQYAALASHYGAIGPADLLAALTAMRGGANTDKTEKPGKSEAKAA